VCVCVIVNACGSRLCEQPCEWHYTTLLWPGKRTPPCKIRHTYTVYIVQGGVSISAQYTIVYRSPPRKIRRIYTVRILQGGASACGCVQSSATLRKDMSIHTSKDGREIHQPPTSSTQ
jgi:hypothetical protein